VKIRPENKYFTVVDQLLLSATAFGTAVATAKYSDIKQLGIYSTFLVLLTLVQTIYASLVSGQMLLYSSNKCARIQHAIFRLTTCLWAIYAVIFISVVGLAYWLLESYITNTYRLPAIATALCVIAITLFEQNRRHYYMQSRFLTSITSTTVFLLIHLCLSLVAYWYFSAKYTAAVALSSLSLSYLAAALLSAPLWRCVRGSKHLPISLCCALQSRYAAQGKFGCGGLVLAWLQNQSINVFLLTFYGATVAGQFSLGRLMATPALVLNNGLMSGVLPELRKKATKGKPRQLAEATQRHSNLSVVLTATYSVCLVFALQAGWLDNTLPAIADAKRFIVFWAFLTALMVWRMWATQFFIALIEFKLLLKCSIVSTTYSLTALIMFSVMRLDPTLTALNIIIGETILIYLLIKHKNRILSVT